MLGKFLLALSLFVFGANATQETDVAASSTQGEDVNTCVQVKVDETGFPIALTYKEMDTLASGGCLKTEAGMKIMALEPQAMIDMIPGTGKRAVRKLMAFTGVANPAKAQPFGDVKTVAGRKIRTYQYIPAIGKVGGQFSVYIEERQASPELRKSPAQADKALEKLKKRDIVATAELQKGRLDPLVISHFIEEQVGALRGLLAESEKALEKNIGLIHEAVRKGDLDAYEYLDLFLQKTRSQVIFLRQQIYFFEKKINAVRAELPHTEPQDWVTLKGIFLNINFLHQEFDEKISAFLEHHHGFMDHHPAYPKSSGLAKQAGYHNVDIASAASPAPPSPSSPLPHSPQISSSSPPQSLPPRRSPPPIPLRPSSPPHSNVLPQESPQAGVEHGEAAQLKQSRDSQ